MVSGKEGVVAVRLVSYGGINEGALPTPTGKLNIFEQQNVIECVSV